MHKSLILLLFALFTSGAALAQTDHNPALAMADSLYAAKQYTQALDVYETLFQDHRYSPAMLLKMAHIQEGLGRLGESLFYLNIYFLTTDDQQALKKMEELAKRNNLEGYDTSQTTPFRTWLRENYVRLAMTLAALSMMLMALAYYQRKKKYSSAAISGVLFAMTLTMLLIHVNFTPVGSRGIVSGPQTYLMSGPSGGASVVAIIGQGHQLEIEGKQDVWLKVKWREADVWIRDNKLREVRL